MIKIQKRWRELPIEKRLEIPSSLFNIDIKEIDRIRKIADTKKKLIEAARLQYETFNDIHSYLTTWIAGFGSDVIIRQNFGSTQELLDLFFKRERFPNKIKPSWQDIKRRVKIPIEMTEELAEETGIHIGDGNLSIYSDKLGKGFRYGISGDLLNEIIYHEGYIAPLIKNIYGLNPSIIRREDKNSIETFCKSKAIVEFKSKILKLPIGTKKEIKIPLKILKNEEFQKRCIVGIIDTDFNITNNVSISGKLNNLFVINEMHKILEENKIIHKFKIYEDYGRFYIRKESAIKIIEEWSLKNQKHLSKYNLFKEFKEFIPFSTTPERLAVLSGEFDINRLKKICEKRRLSKL